MKALDFAISGGADTKLRFAFVQEIAPDSLARQLGFEVGDILVSVDDRSLLTATHDECISFLRQKRPCAIQLWRIGLGQWQRLVSLSHSMGTYMNYSQVIMPLSMDNKAIVTGPILSLQPTDCSNVKLFGGFNTNVGSLIVESVNGTSTALQPGDRLLEVRVFCLLKF